MASGGSGHNPGSPQTVEELAESYFRLQQEAEELRAQVRAKDKALKKERRRSGRPSELLRIEDDVVLDHTIKARPSKYTGNTDWATYHSQFEMIARLYGWCEKTKEYMLFTSLEGDALEAVGQYNDSSYEEMCYQLDRSFGPGEEETATAKLQARILKKDETLDHLARDLKSLVKSAKPKDNPRSQSATAAEYFIKALPDPEVRLQLKDLRIRDIDEAVNRAEILIANRASEKLTKEEVKTTPVSPADALNIKNLEDKISQLTIQVQKKEESNQKTCARGFEEKKREDHKDYPGDEERRGYQQHYRGNKGRGRGQHRGNFRGQSRGYGRGSRNFQNNYYRPRNVVTCYRCGMKGHVQMWCPMTQQQSPQMQTWTNFPNPQVPSFTPSSSSSNYDSNHSYNHLNRGGQV